jgi:DNA-binding NtrC family response regulator
MEGAASMARLLVSSRDSAIIGAVWSIAEANCWRMETAADALAAMERIQCGAAADLLVLDITSAPENGLRNGLPALRTLRRSYPRLPLVVIGHSGDIQIKLNILRMGACDYLCAPLQDGQLEVVIRHNLSVKDEDVEIDITSDDVETVGNDSYFIAISSSMRQLRAQVARLAETDSPAFVVGEPGSGRETTARLLHKWSLRSAFEFAKVNCAALPEELLEREIFGCEAGGAAGSLKAKRGKLELCDRGTIFLDEITEIPLRLQGKLAQTMRDGRFTRRGGPDYIEVDLRVVAASTIPLDRAVAEHRLLEGLARLLSAGALRVPALRERKEELPFLSCHFMHRLAKRYRLPPREIVQSVSEAWQAHDWPDNLRELEQSVKRYLVAGDKVGAFEQGATGEKDEEPAGATTMAPNGNGEIKPRRAHGGILGYKSLRALLQSVKEEAERNAIAWALETTGWNRKAAARLLKTSYRTVLYKIEQYQMHAYGLPSASTGNGFESRESGNYGDKHADVESVVQSNINGGRLREQ